MAFDLIGGLTAGSTLAGTVDSILANYKNFNLQKENLAYQKDLQNKIFAREDNAVQRRVNDLIKAGLSPTLAAGSSAGAGSVVSTSAPQRKDSLEALTALASVKTLLAQQQRAQTEADIAKANLEQVKLDNKYYKSNNISPVEANMGWQQQLTNFLVGLINGRRGELSESVGGLFNNTYDVFANALSDSWNFAKNRNRNFSNPLNGVSFNKSPFKAYVNKYGDSINFSQMVRLKNYGLLSDWYNGTRSKEVNYIIHKYDNGTPPIFTVGKSAKVFGNTIKGWFNK